MSTSANDVHDGADWHQRVVSRSLRTATRRSIDRGSNLVLAAAALLERSNGDAFTVQDVANEAGQSLRTLYQHFESKDDLLLAVFEEAMRAYDQMIREAIVGLSEPLERLAGALIAAVRLPEYTATGVNGGLSRLRLRLTQVDPELVGRAQAPVSSMFRELVEATAAEGSIRADDPDAATFLLLSLTSAWITSRTLGNDHGDHMAPVDLASFCLKGLGARLAPDYLDAVAGQLALPARPISVVDLPAASAP